MELKTRRLIIRPLEISDWPAMREILADFENSDVFMYDYKAPTDADSVRTLIPFWVRSRNYYTITLDKSGEIIGFLSLVGDELGFTLKTEYKRNGYGYESAFALLGYMFDKRGMDCFTAQAAMENIRSVKLLEKLGFRLVSLIDVTFREELPAVECGNFILDL